MKKKTTIAAISAAGILALGAGVPAIAAADSETTPPGTSSSEDLREQFEERRDAAEQEFAERLAEELGVDADEVAAAIDKIRTEMMDERAAERLAQLEERLAAAVEAGNLTQEQADVLLELAEKRADERLDGFGGRGFGGGFGHGPGHGPGHGLGWGAEGDESFGESGSAGGSASSTGVAFTL